MKGRTAMVSIAIITLMVISGIAVMPLQPAHAQTQIYSNMFTTFYNGTVAVFGISNNTIWKWISDSFVNSQAELIQYSSNVFIIGGTNSTNTEIEEMGIYNFTIWRSEFISTNSSIAVSTRILSPALIAGSNIYIITGQPSTLNTSLYIVGINNLTAWKLFWGKTWNVGSVFYYQGDVYFTCLNNEMGVLNATTYSFTDFYYGGTDGVDYAKFTGQDFFIANGNFFILADNDTTISGYIFLCGLTNHTQWKNVTSYRLGHLSYNPNTGLIYGLYYSSSSNIYWYLFTVQTSSPYKETNTSQRTDSNTQYAPPVFTPTNIYINTGYTATSEPSDIIIIGIANLTEWKTITVSGTSSSYYSIIQSETAYQVQFTQTSLGYGDWYVNVTGQTPSGAISFTVTNFDMNLPAGTYSYTIATNYKIEKPVPSSGSFTVSSSNVQINVTFEFVYYTLTFKQDTLPAGNWYVNITDNESMSHDKFSLYSQAIPYTQTSYIDHITNGTVNYTISSSDKVYKPSPSSGVIDINGANAYINITFGEVTYTVTLFAYSGYTALSLKPWSIVFNGEVYNTTGRYLNFTETNGSYSFSSYNKAYYTINPSSGTITVNGSNVKQDFNLTASTYSIIITETGDTSATWAVSYNGTEYSNATGDPITLTAFNGTYNFTAVGTVWADPVPHFFTVVVDGNVNYIKITFYMNITVRFVETGLPAGTGWTVNVQGIGALYSTTNTIVISQYQHRYISFTVNNLNNTYIPNPSGEDGLQVTNGSIITITFSQNLPPVINTTFVDAFAAVGAIGVMAALYFYFRRRQLE